MFPTDVKKKFDDEAFSLLNGSHFGQTLNNSWKIYLTTSKVSSDNEDVRFRQSNFLYHKESFHEG